MNEETKNETPKNEMPKDESGRDEKESQSADSDWKKRFNEFAHTFQHELKRTTQIGMKMLSASQSNAQLHECYEKLGRMAKSDMDKSSLSWDRPEAKELCERIAKLEKELEGFEEDVQEIKKS